MPNSNTSLNDQDIAAVSNLWNSVLATDILTVGLDMSNIISCIDCKARFMHNKYEVDQNVTVELFIRLVQVYNFALYKYFYA